MADLNPSSKPFTDVCEFEQVYKRYWKSMYELGCYYTQDSAFAEEMVQDIFKSLWERKDHLQIRGPIENYLFRSVKLKIAEHYRQQTLHQKHLDQIGRSQTWAEFTTEEQVFSQELSQRLEQLTIQLPTQSRRVFELSRNHGLSNRQIASELALSEKTIENYLTRALHFLRQRLSDYLS